MLVALLLVLVCGATAAVLVGWATVLNRAQARAEEARRRAAFAQANRSLRSLSCVFAQVGVYANEANRAFARLGRTYARLGAAVREEE